MRGRRRLHHTSSASPLSFSTALASRHGPPTHLAVTLALRSGSGAAQLDRTLRTPTRIFSAVAPGASRSLDVPPIRSTQDLHTTLLSYAHAATLPFPRHTEEERAVGPAPTDQTRSVVESPAHERDATTTGVSSTETERRLLQKLLLHRRQRRRETDSATRPPFFSTARPSSAKPREPASAAVAAHLSPHASWARAFELFSEAVQQHHVSPTAQHFNLLLYIAQQHRLWKRVDEVEEFQAHLLASVQHMTAEKKREERRQERAGMAERRLASAAAAAASSRTISATASTPTSLTHQINELREMEAALMPNAQTYELLLTAALARGAWTRALEYCEMRTRSGVAVLTDASVRQVLQVYALAAATSAAEPAPQQAPQQPIHDKVTQRLRTDQQGPQLRAAAKPRTTPAAPQQSAATSAEPHWLVGLRFFRSSLYRVTTMQTVWCMVALLHHTGQYHEVLQVVQEDCDAVVQAAVYSLAAAHIIRDPLERRALLWTLQAVSDAAREVGDWPAAQRLLRNVVELRRQQSYALGVSAGSLWGAAPLSGEDSVGAFAPASAAHSGTPLPSFLSPTLSAQTSAMAVLAEDDDGDTRVQNEEQLSQHVLQNTLHTLRRVRRYTNMVDLHRASAPCVSDSGAGVEMSEVARVWRTMWTPAAISFVAQAALATGNLDLLLELCGLEDSNATAAAHADTPADVYDAALRLLQSRILQHHIRFRAMHQEASTSVASSEAQSGEATEVRRYVTLSQRVYTAYRRRALATVAARESPYHQYLHRATEKMQSGKPSSLKAKPHLQEEKQRFRQAQSTVPATHAPLVQLLAQRPTSDRAQRSLSQQALEQFKQLRRPDALAVAIAMDIVHSDVSKSSATRGSAEQPHCAVAPLSDAEAQSALLAIEGVYNAVLESEHLAPMQLCRTNTAAQQPARDAGGVSPQQLTALCAVTSAAVLMSLEALAIVQPLALLRLIPRAVELGWLPCGMAQERLRIAQDAVVAWTEKQQRRPETTVVPPAATASHRRAATSPFPSPASTILDAAGTSGAAVERFARLYAQLALSPTTGTTGGRRGEAVAQAGKVLAAAAQVLAEVQRAAAGHPPTAAMAAFKAALHDVWQRRVPSANSSVLPPLSDVAVIVSLNAVVQQVGASTVSRWTLWGDCADLLSGYVTPPFSPHTLDAEGEERQRSGLRIVAPSRETLRVLQTFIRLCDKAEAPFVEFVVMRWILGGHEEARAAKTAATVRQLIALCSQAPHSTSLAEVHMEGMLLVLEALAWACRARDKVLARRLCATLTPWIDVLASLPSESPLTPLSGSYADQLARLRDAAQSSSMAVLQCLSSGTRHEVLRDWPVAQHILRAFSASVAKVIAAATDPSSSASSVEALRHTAVLVDSLAAVALKLQRTFHFQLTEIVLDSQRALAEDDERVKTNETKGTEGGTATISLAHRTAVTAAAEALSAWCANVLLSSLILPCLHRWLPREEGCSDAVSKSPRNEGVSASSMLLLSSASRVTAAVWELDFAAFVCRTAFRPRTTVAGDGGDASSVQWVRQLRQRGYQLLASELRVAAPLLVVAGHLRLWLLFSVYRSATASTDRDNVSGELCRDLTTLETLCAMQPASPAASFLLLFLRQVDDLSTAMQTRATSVSSAPLQGFAGTSTATDLLAKPSLHFSPAALRVLQQAAQQVLYLSLCEGTADVQALAGAGKSTERSPSPSPLLPPALLRRCLAWPGHATLYPALLRAVEGAAYETLREPDAVVDVFTAMVQLRRAEDALSPPQRSAAGAAGGCNACLQASSAAMFLDFYVTSAALRRASPVSERVCLAALLACAAAASGDGDGLLDPPPQSLITLLCAFPHVLSDALYRHWRRRALTRRQETALRSWMLTLLWGGTQKTTTPPAASVVQLFCGQSPTSFPSPLRRAALEWLLLTQGTVLPQSFPSVKTSAASTDAAQRTQAEHLLSSLDALFDTACASFVDLVKGPATRVEALTTAHERPHSIFPSAAAPATTMSTDSGSCEGADAVAVAAAAAMVRVAVSQCATRQSVQRLVQRYDAADVTSAERRPVLLCAEEREALLKLLPADAQDAAKVALETGAEALPDEEMEKGASFSRNRVESSVPWTVALDRWIDALSRRPLGSGPLPVPPVQGLPSAADTWKGVEAAVIAAARARLSLQETGIAEVRAAWTRQRVSSLRPIVDHLVGLAVGLHIAGKTAAAEEVGASVNALLVFSCLCAPLSGQLPFCSPAGAVSLLRCELLRLLTAFTPLHPAAISEALAPSVPSYAWLIAQHVRPLMLTLATPDVAAAVPRGAAVNAFSSGALLTHHACLTACALCLSHASLPERAFDCVYEAAGALFQQSCSEFSALRERRQTTSGGDAALPSRAVRAWLQAGVLLGENRSLLRVGQSLTAHFPSSQQQQQSGDAAAAAAEEDDAWWGALLAAAMVCAAVRRPGAVLVQDDALARLLDARLPRQSRDSAAALLCVWEREIRHAAHTAPLPGDAGGGTSTLALVQHRSYVTRLLHAQPFSLILRSLSSRTGHAEQLTGASDREILNSFRSSVVTYLTGPSSAYPLPTAQTLASRTEATQLTPESVRAAMQCIQAASVADMKAFVRLESTKRGASRVGSGESATVQRGRAVQAAWHLVEAAARQHRQQASGLSAVTGTVPQPPPLVPLSQWTALLLNQSFAAVPHTIHFVSLAVTEVVILESCRDWAEALSILEHSLGTLQHTGATPVQQYMAQLLLQRLRTSASLAPPSPAGNADAFAMTDFGAGLGEFSHCVSAPDTADAQDAMRHLWHRCLPGHVAHHTAALVCRIVDVLLDSHKSHSGNGHTTLSSSRAPRVDQHTLLEALRCSVHDSAVTDALFRLYWAQDYRRVSGAHPFLSALRAAKLARSEPLALRVILTYLWVTTTGPATQRAERWTACVYPLLRRGGSASAGADLAAAGESAVESTRSTHALSVETHHAVWKSWTGLCRMHIISDGAALAVVEAFKALDRLTEVEELMVTTCYTLKR